MTEFEELPKEVTDEVAYVLTGMKKIQADEKKYSLGLKSFECKLKSMEGTEQFSLDYGRGTYTLKYKMQCRARTTIQLVRLDVNGHNHTNPSDDTYVCPERDPFARIHRDYINYHFTPGESHIHIYRKGFGCRWAYPVPEDFTDLNNKSTTLRQFEEWCNIEHIFMKEELKDREYYISRRG